MGDNHPYIMGSPSYEETTSLMKILNFQQDKQTKLAQSLINDHHHADPLLSRVKIIRLKHVRGFRLVPDLSPQTGIVMHGPHVNSPIMTNTNHVLSTRHPRDVKGNASHRPSVFVHRIHITGVQVVLDFDRELLPTIFAANEVQIRKHGIFLSNKTT
jgi:hypothetical protein